MFKNRRILRRFQRSNLVKFTQNFKRNSLRKQRHKIWYQRLAKTQNFQKLILRFYKIYNVSRGLFSKFKTFHKVFHLRIPTNRRYSIPKHNQPSHADPLNSLRSQKSFQIHNLFTFHERDQNEHLDKSSFFLLYTQWIGVDFLTQ